MGKTLSEVKALPSSEITAWEAYFSTHVPRETLTANEWAATRQLIHATRAKPLPIDKYLLTYGSKRQTQEEITRNLGIIKTALKAK